MGHVPEKLNIIQDIIPRSGVKYGEGILRTHKSAVALLSGALLMLVLAALVLIVPSCIS